MTTILCKKCGDNLHVQPSYGESRWGFCSQCDPDLQDIPTADDAADLDTCDMCGQPTDDATDGLCPCCLQAQADFDDAANTLDEAEAEVERLMEELIEAKVALKVARIEDKRAEKALDARWALAGK